MVHRTPDALAGGPIPGNSATLSVAAAAIAPACVDPTRAKSEPLANRAGYPRKKKQFSQTYLRRVLTAAPLKPRTLAISRSGDRHLRRVLTAAPLKPDLATAYGDKDAISAVFPRRPR